MSDVFRVKNNLLKKAIFFLILLSFIGIACKGNNDKNDPPSIYDLNAPDFVAIGLDAGLFIHLSVSDPQGLDDIESVYFTIENSDSVMLPDTSLMYDNGNSGDAIASDGIYTFALNSGNTPQEAGDYIYHFRAIDSDGLSSDTLGWMITVGEDPSPYVYDSVAPESLQNSFPGDVRIYVSASDPQGLADIDKVFFTIRQPDSTMLPDTSFMYDNGGGGDETAGDGTYTFTLDSPIDFDQVGDFEFIFEAIDLESNVSNTISETITIGNNPNPVVYDLIAPDSLQKGSQYPAYLFIKAWDPQGLSDIDSIYFTVRRPDSTTNSYRFYMYDDGDLLNHGDSVATDGVYSLGILPPDQNSQTGYFTFYFTGFDSDHNEANTIAKRIKVYEGAVGFAKISEEYSGAFVVNKVWQNER